MYLQTLALIRVHFTGRDLSAARSCRRPGRARQPSGLLPVLLVCGLGFGMVIPSLVTLVLRVALSDYEGAASGVLVTAQPVAGAFGVALSGVLFFGLLRLDFPYPTAFAKAFGRNVALFLATAVLAQVVRDAR
jgi:hypothetical protein